MKGNQTLKKALVVTLATLMVLVAMPLDVAYVNADEGPQEEQEQQEHQELQVEQEQQEEPVQQEPQEEEEQQPPEEEAPQAPEEPEPEVLPEEPETEVLPEEPEPEITPEQPEQPETQEQEQQEIQLKPMQKMQKGSKNALGQGSQLGTDLSSLGTIEVKGAVAVDPASGATGSVRLTFVDGCMTVSGANLYVSEEKHGDNFVIYAIGDVNISLQPDAGFKGELFVNGTMAAGPGMDVTVEAGGPPVMAEAQFVNDQGGNPPGPGPQQGGPDDIDFDITVTDTHINAFINNALICDDRDGIFYDKFKGTIPSAGFATAEENNTLRLGAPFGDYGFLRFTINGVVYEKDDPSVQISEEDGTWTITVPGSSKYTIVGEADTSGQLARTIIWANVDADQENPEFAKDMQLAHGKGRIIAIYDAEGNKVNGVIDVDPATGMGWVPVEPGSSVVFEFVPDYGYQLTGVSANGMALEPQDTINQYVFTMPDTNIHFAAEFTKIEDIVQSNSNKVSGGSINLSGSDMLGGSAQLHVSDAELDSDKVNAFQDAAGEYTVSDYFDIDLYNVFYKGKNDAQDVWSMRVDELSDGATISIVLEEGVSAEDIVIVHNIHNGAEYEIIEIESYDPATNTITFRTSSFSSYAIAVKDKEAEKDPGQTTPAKAPTEKPAKDKPTTDKAKADKQGTDKVTVAKKSETKTLIAPKTADSSEQMRWLMLFIAAAFGLYCMQREERNRNRLL